MKQAKYLVLSKLTKEKRDPLDGRGPFGKSVVIGETDRDTGQIVARVTDSNC